MGIKLTFAELTKPTAPKGDDMRLEQILSLMESFRDELQALKPVAALIEDKPGLQQQAKLSMSQKVLGAAKEGLLPLRDILPMLGATLTTAGSMIRVGNAVAANYKVQYGEVPEGYMTTNKLGFISRKGNGYMPQHYPLIQTVLSQFGLI